MNGWCSPRSWTVRPNSTSSGTSKTHGARTHRWNDWSNHVSFPAGLSTPAVKSLAENNSARAVVEKIQKMPRTMNPNPARIRLTASVRRH